MLIIWKNKVFDNIPSDLLRSLTIFKDPKIYYDDPNKLSDCIDKNFKFETTCVEYAEQPSLLFDCSTSNKVKLIETFTVNKFKNCRNIYPFGHHTVF